MRRLARSKARAFTMMEMMVVVAIIGIVAAIAVPNLMPVVDRMRLAAAGEHVAAFFDRARRLAYNEGRCYRVTPSGNGLALQRLAHADCWTTTALTNANWETAEATLKPETAGITYTFEIAPASGTHVVANSIIFRPNGRVRGDRDLDITDDGGRVVLAYPKVAPMEAEVRVTSNGRTCGAIHRNGAPAMPSPVTCGTGYVSGGAGGGGGCSATSSEDNAGLAAFALALLALRRRRTPAKSARRRTRPRGYLLFEVMVSSGILAVILGGTIGVITSARREISVAPHRATAAQVAQAKADELVALPHNLALAAMSGSDNPIAEVPSITRTWSVSATGLDTQSTPNLRSSTALYEVTVTVTYPTVDGTGTLTYKRYKRSRTFQ